VAIIARRNGAVPIDRAIRVRTYLVKRGDQSNTAMAQEV
jgi:hypothetical protein